MNLLLQKAIERLKTRLGTEEESIITRHTGKEKLISIEKFEAIQRMKQEMPIVFIDGGNAEILGSSTFSLNVIRIAAISFSKNKPKTTKRTFFCLAQIEADGHYKVITEPEQNLVSNPERKQKSEKESPDEKCIDIRRIAELNEAKTQTFNVAEIIVLDGSLILPSIEQKTHIQELERHAIKNNKTIIGISKTSTMYTTKGRPTSIALSDIAQKNNIQAPWIYFVEQVEGITTFYAKLNKRTSHILRIDCFESQEKRAKEALCKLMNHANDPLMPGYLYGLIMADNEARISENEKKALRNKALYTAGNDRTLLEAALLTKEAHQKLDRLKY